MKKILTVTAMAAMLLAGCSKEEGGVCGEKRVVIDPTMIRSSVANASTRASETDFEDNDAIGLTITTSDKTNYVENAKFLFDEAKGKFVSPDNMLWYEDTNDKSTLFAYYPYVEGAAIPAEFAVAANQNGAGYAASDFMSAMKVDVLPTTKAIGMTFKHKTARIIVNIDNETDFPVTKVVIKGAIGTGVIDAGTNALTVKENGAEQAVTAGEVLKGTKYYALLIPQPVKLKIEVTTDEGVRTQTLAEANLAGGKNHTFNARVLPAEMEVVMEDEITGWEDGDDLYPEGSEPIDNSVEYGGVKYKTVAMKDGRIWMASNLCYLPSGKTPSDDPVADAGVWYPLQLVKDGDAYNAQVSKDAEYIQKAGYFYDFATAAGGVTITADNYLTFEGVRGICPEGWHIPTQAEINALVAAYRVGESTLYTALDADGFNTTFTQMRSKNTSLLTGAWSTTNKDGVFMAGYIMCSTGYKYEVKEETGAITNQNKYLMFMSTNGKLTVANSSNFAGLPLRCIKDKAQ